MNADQIAIHIIIVFSAWLATGIGILQGHDQAQELALAIGATFAMAMHAGFSWGRR